MEQIKKFLHGKGFALLLTASLLAAAAAGIPSLFMINKRGETRPMVDLTGKFYLLDELDENFVKECVDVEKYKEYQGAWVKNAYNPVFMIDGKYDEKAAQAAESSE